MITFACGGQGARDRDSDRTPATQTLLRLRGSTDKQQTISASFELCYRDQANSIAPVG